MDQGPCLAGQDGDYAKLVQSMLIDERGAPPGKMRSGCRAAQGVGWAGVRHNQAPRPERSAAASAHGL